MRYFHGILPCRELRLDGLELPREQHCYSPDTPLYLSFSCWPRMLLTAYTPKRQACARAGITDREVAVAPRLTASARRLGIVSALCTVFLMVAYAITLAIGLLTLPSPQEPIADPYFSIMEILIILTAPVMVALMAAVHAWSAPESKTFSLMALLFMALMTGLTCGAAFCHPDARSPVRVHGAAVAAAVPGIQMALGCLRPRHPRLGCVFRTGSALCRTSIPWWSPCLFDPHAAGDQWHPCFWRTTGSCRQRHAIAQHRHRRLRRRVHRRRGVAGHPFPPRGAAGTPALIRNLGQP